MRDTNHTELVEIPDEPIAGRLWDGSFETLLKQGGPDISENKNDVLSDKPYGT